MTISRFPLGRTLLSAALLTLAIQSAMAAAAPIRGTHWSFAGDSGPSSRHVEFGGGGRMTGFGGCNAFYGGYTLKNGALKTGPVVSTLRACAEDVMARETDFFRILETARSVEVAEAGLLLKGEDGAVLATLVRLPTN